MRFLLDTNILSHMMRDPHGVVTRKIAEVGEKNVFTSVLAIAEIRFGIQKTGSKRLAKELAWLQPHIKAEPWTAAAELHYATIRVAIEAMGLPVGQIDMLLGAQASAAGATFVTDNEKHFRHMPGVKVENWLR